MIPVTHATDDELFGLLAREKPQVQRVSLSVEEYRRLMAESYLIAWIKGFLRGPVHPEFAPETVEMLRRKIAQEVGL